MATATETTRRRGRPREFDPEEVLARALDVFLERGYSASSLDDLAGAMGMNRPSLYNAFGNKESLYRHVFARFTAMMNAEVDAVFAAHEDLRGALSAT